jgi:glycosyltransferase involved in cell wall biosynthesis
MKVAIIHPWFPQYRLGFFENLVMRAAEEGIVVTIFHGDPPPEWRDRNDVEASDSFIRLPTRFFNVRGRTLNRKSLKRFWEEGPFDIVIVEQAVRNIETYELFLKRTQLAYWGHGKTYTLEISAGQERLKQWLTRRGKWFFAYTRGGVEAVVAAGFCRDRTTVVQNSIDTSTLQRQIAAVEVSALQEFSSLHDLKGKTAIFVGGLDASKRLNFLLDAAEQAHLLEPDFRLLIVGAGTDRNIVESRTALMPYVTYLGSLFGADKALAIRVSQVMAMPGRVGLVAVDSFAGGTPIVTTDWAWHAPEFEYLEPGVNAVITSDDHMIFARKLVSVLRDDVGLAALVEACIRDSGQYTVQAMAENFVDGLRKALVIDR